MENWLKLTTVGTEALASHLSRRLEQVGIPNYYKPSRIEPMFNPAYLPHHIFVRERDISLAIRFLRGEWKPPKGKK